MNVQSNNCTSYEYKLGDNSLFCKFQSDRSCCVIIQTRTFDTIVRLIIEIIDSDVMSNEFELH